MMEPLPERGGALNAASYTFDALQPVLSHPNLAAETAEIGRMGSILEGVAELGHASVKEDNVEEFQQWRTFAAGYIGEVARRDPIAASNLRGSLAKLLLYGSTAGVLSASDDLHSMLASDPVGPLEAVVDGCAALQVPSQVWVNAYGISPAHKAELEISYHAAQRRHHPGQPSAASNFGGLSWSEHAATARLEGLTESYVLDRGHELIGIVPDAQKQQLFMRLQRALEETDGPISMQTHQHFEKFVMRAIVDPSLSD